MLRALNKYLQHVNIYIEAHGSKFVLAMIELQTIIELELLTQKPGYQRWCRILLHIQVVNVR